MRDRNGGRRPADQEGDYRQPPTPHRPCGVALPVESDWLKSPMPLPWSVRIAASEFILSLQASAICPLFWGLAYLGVTSAGVFLSLAMMFSITLWQALGAAYARYYHRQAVAAIEAICEARE